MADHDFPPRPATPQVLLHRVPDRPTSSEEPVQAPLKYIILIEGSTGVAGKVQIAGSVAKSLSCPLYLGDSVHESSAKAASVGTRSIISRAAVSEPPMSDLAIRGGQVVPAPMSGPNEARYQRMWLSKMTRTGLLFPDESRPATEGFPGFGGSASTSTSRRESVSSVASMSSHDSSVFPSVFAQSTTTALPAGSSVPSINAVFTIPEKERLRRANPALMVLTHPELDSWHRLAIRKTIREYGIGIIFVPLHDKDIDYISEKEQEEEDIPILQPLNPSTMTSFPVSSFPETRSTTATGSLDRHMGIHINTDADIEGIITQAVEGAKSIMGIS